MEPLRKISLNTDWQYRFAPQSEDYSSVMDNNSDWNAITFDDIPILKMSLQDVLWLGKRFDLTPTDACVRYFLRCDGNITPMIIYLRGQAIAQWDNVSGLDVDVTDYVSLDDNLLVLAVGIDGQTSSVQQSELYLQPIYCDDLN